MCISEKETYRKREVCLKEIAGPEVGKQAVFEAGGVAVLMEALARHKTSAEVCAQASWRWFLIKWFI